MAYAINHVHIRAADPHTSASWYEKHFGAKILSAREVMPGTITVSMELDGPVRLNISSQLAGSSPRQPEAELNRLGLEHFGFATEDLEADLDRLKGAGIRVVPPQFKFDLDFNGTNTASFGSNVSTNNTGSGYNIKNAPNTGSGTNTGSDNGSDDSF